MPPPQQPVSNSPAPALNCAGRLLTLDRPRVMGILNVTPDSFSDGGADYRDGRIDLGRVRERARQMVADGADIIDIGGESTRPGAPVVSEQEEMDRVLPVVESLAAEFDVVLSLDTSTPRLMLEGAARGAGLINDVRALRRPGAIEAVAATGLPVCLMHMRGEPGTMQQMTDYDDVVADVGAFLQQRTEACTRLGLARRNLLLDPGFGFSKSAEQNLTLLNRLPQLAALGYPLLVGLSRKSLIGQVLGRPVQERLAGSLALAVMAAMSGALILRVHDVRETVDAVRLCTAVTREQI